MRQRKPNKSEQDELNPCLSETYKVKSFISRKKIGEESGSNWFEEYELQSLHKRDVEPFIKLYKVEELVIILVSLPPVSVKIFHFILTCLRNESDIVRLDDTSAKECNITKAVFYKGLAELLKTELIFKHLSPCTYWINLNFMFKGNRIKFIKDHYGEDYLKII